MENQKFTNKKFIPNIPISWIEKALVLKKSGNATKLALFIWYQTRLLKQEGGVKISSGKAERFGVDQTSFPRTLDLLESLGMISVQRLPNRSPKVKVILEEEK